MLILRSLQAYLAQRHRGFCEAATDNNLDFWGEIWSGNRESLKNQRAALLFKRMEKGWPRKDKPYAEGYEDGYREALSALPSLWAQCNETIKRTERKAEVMKKVGKIV